MKYIDLLKIKIEYFPIKTIKKLNVNYFNYFLSGCKLELSPFQLDVEVKTNKRGSKHPI